MDHLPWPVFCVLRSLIEFQRRFSDERACAAYLFRHPDGRSAGGCALVARSMWRAYSEPVSAGLYDASPLAVLPMTLGGYLRLNRLSRSAILPPWAGSGCAVSHHQRSGLLRRKPGPLFPRGIVRAGQRNGAQPPEGACPHQYPPFRPTRRKQPPRRCLPFPGPQGVPALPELGGQRPPTPACGASNKSPAGIPLIPTLMGEGGGGGT